MYTVYQDSNGDYCREWTDDPYNYDENEEIYDEDPSVDEYIEEQIMNRLEENEKEGEK